MRIAGMLAAAAVAGAALARRPPRLALRLLLRD
jgi:hypothetical protein